MCISFINNKIGVQEGTYQVDGIFRISDTNNTYKKLPKNLKESFLSSNVSVEIYDNVTRDELLKAVDDEYGIDVQAATQWVVATLRGGGSVESTDRYSRLWKNIYPLLTKNLDVNIAVGLTNTLAKDVNDVRINIKNNTANFFK